MQGFLELGRYGSLSAASRALGISQPTLSRRLALLEETLGVSLFLRGPRGLVPTAAGERLVKVAESMREAASWVPELMAAGHDPVSGVVRVTAPEAGLATEWLPKALLPLRTLHPGLVVQIAVENRVVEMSKREADIAIRNQRPTDGALTTRAVGTFAWYLYAAPEYLERRPAISELTDLMQHDILLYETPSDNRQSRWLSQRRLLGRVVLSSNSVDALARAARVGWGIAMLPAFVADRDTGLRRVLLERPITKMPLWLVTHAQLKRSPRVQAVFRQLARRFEETRERPH